MRSEDIKVGEIYESSVGQRKKVLEIINVPTFVGTPREGTAQHVRFVVLEMGPTMRNKKAAIPVGEERVQHMSSFSKWAVKQVSDVEGTLKQIACGM